jgi:hypothetical protein
MRSTLGMLTPYGRRARNWPENRSREASLHHAVGDVGRGGAEARHELVNVLTQGSRSSPIAKHRRRLRALLHPAIFRPHQTQVEWGNSSTTLLDAPVSLPPWSPYTVGPAVSDPLRTSPSDPELSGAAPSTRSCGHTLLCPVLLQEAETPLRPETMHNTRSGHW